MEGLEPDERTPFPDEPTETSVQCAFVPKNPYRGKTMFTGRLSISRTIQNRPAHIDHEVTHYCHSQRKVTKEMCVKAKDTYEKECNQGNVPESSCLSDFFISVESDDKAKIPFGNPGRAIDTNARPHGLILAGIEHQYSSNKSPRARVAKELDHSYHLGFLSASVNLFQEIPSQLNQSWVQGQIKVTLKDSVFNGYHGMKHYAELALKILQRASRRHGKIMFENLRRFMEMKEEDKNELLAFVPVVLFIRHDGGHDHKSTLLQNIAALVAFVELFQLHALVNNRNAPDG
jgi:hypothetical protein